MKKEVKNEITINSSIQNVWKVLTESEYTKIYMFGCEVITDWKVGSTIQWAMEYEGKPFIPVTGNILEIEPMVKLKYSVIDPNANYPTIPENHLQVTYLLESLGDQTKLTVIQDGFEGVAEEEKRYKDVYNDGMGWQPILDQMKTIAEQL